VTALKPLLLVQTDFDVIHDDAAVANGSLRVTYMGFPFSLNSDYAFMSSQNRSFWADEPMFDRFNIRLSLVGNVAFVSTFLF
jgi:hypothetical protein